MCAGIQVFMSTFMVLRFQNSTPFSTRSNRLPYLVVSCVLTLLSCASAVIEGISTFHTLLGAPPTFLIDEEGLMRGKGVYKSVQGGLGMKGELVWNISVWISEAVLVRTV
jgi:hypothetical protein